MILIIWTILDHSDHCGVGASRAQQTGGGSLPSLPWLVSGGCCSLDYYGRYGRSGERPLPTRRNFNVDWPVVGWFGWAVVVALGHPNHRLQQREKRQTPGHHNNNKVWHNLQVLKNTGIKIWEFKKKLSNQNMTHYWNKHEPISPTPTTREKTNPWQPQ